MKSEAQLKILAISAAVKKDKSAREVARINFDAYNAGTSPSVTIDVIGDKQNCPR